MKPLNTIVIITLIVFFFTSCESKKEKNKAFLDYYLGMSIDEYRTFRDSLIKSDKIKSEEDPFDSYTFVLPDGEKANVRFSPKFDNDFLTSINLEFGYYRSSYSSYGNSFVDIDESKDIESVLQLYIQKYGSPQNDKKSYLDRNGEYNEFDVYKWDNGEFEIIFCPGIKEKGAMTVLGDRAYLSTGGRIEYVLKSEERDKLNLKKAEDNIKDL